MGLLKTAAKVAVASSVHGRVQRHQQQKWAEQDGLAAASHAAPVAHVPPPVPAAVPAGTDDMLAQLERLGSLRDAGILTAAEFEVQKARILMS